MLGYYSMGFGYLADISYFPKILSLFFLLCGQLAPPAVKMPWGKVLVLVWDLKSYVVRQLAK